MSTYWCKVVNLVDPVDLRAQSDLIGAPEPMSIEAARAAPIGGSARVLPNPLRDSA
jgi:hypothetical protein